MKSSRLVTFMPRGSHKSSQTTFYKSARDETKEHSISDYAYESKQFLENVTRFTLWTSRKVIYYLKITINKKKHYLRLSFVNLL